VRQPVPFGKYLLLDRISVGGMAEVFRAKSFGVEGFEKLIAIKRILPSMADDREFLRMFVDEAKIAGQLSHPSIAQIYELGREGSAPYIAMEYVWGKDLLQLYNRFRKLGERMPITMACHVIAKVSEALDYAHRKRDPLGVPLQIVHRDCSPQNILVSYEGEVKVIDFGIAKAASRVSHTNAGVLKGKFAYLSPEQVRGDPVDRRSDLFALGTVFFECLTGERLFHSESDFATLERVRDADVPRPREVCPELPEEVERVVLRALARDPADRYQHGREMYRELQAFLRSQEHPYTASALGAWVRRAFPEELDRERQLLDRYRLIGPDGTRRRASGPIAASRETAEVLLSSRDHVGGDDDLTTEDLFGPDGDGGPTLLGGPTLAGLSSSGGAASSSLGRVPRPAASSDYADEAPTEVHGEIGSDPRPDPIGAGASPDADGKALIDAVRGGRSARRDPFDSSPPGAPSAAKASPGQDGIEDIEPASSSGISPPAASTLRAPGGAPMRASRKPPPVPPTAGRTLRMGTSAPSAPVSARAPQPPREPTASVRLPTLNPGGVRGASAPSPGGSIVKDIGIGMAIAAVVLLLFLGARVLFLSSEAAGAELGSLEVDLVDLDEVTVLVDGEKVGESQHGALMLEDVQPGPRLVEVIRDGDTLCSREIRVRAGAVAAMSCAAPKPPALPGALILEGASEGHRIRLDGEEVEADPTSEAIKLAGDQAQRVEVLSADGELLHSFEVTAKPGELVRRRLDQDTVHLSEEPADLEPTAGRPAASSPRPAASNDPEASPRDGVELAPPTVGEPETGYLIARTRPWARVHVDGRDTGVMTPIAPRAKIPLRPGPRRITFVVGDQSFTYQVTIEAGQTHELVEELPVNR
jgi:eukaryotic-like serine/threonine-protein kinase